jgi:hypothetical protein
VFGEKKIPVKACREICVSTSHGEDGGMFSVGGGKVSIGIASTSSSEMAIKSVIFPYIYAQENVFHHSCSIDI